MWMHYFSLIIGVIIVYALSLPSGHHCGVRYGHDCAEWRHYFHKCFTIHLIVYSFMQSTINRWLSHECKIQNTKQRPDFLFWMNLKRVLRHGELFREDFRKEKKEQVPSCLFAVGQGSLVWDLKLVLVVFFGFFFAFKLINLLSGNNAAAHSFIFVDLHNFFNKKLWRGPWWDLSVLVIM